MIPPGDTVVMLALAAILAQLAGMLPPGDRRPERREVLRASRTRWWLPPLAGGAALLAGCGTSEAVVLAAAMAVVALLDSVGEP